MLDRIAAALDRHPDVHDWTLRRRRARRSQLYLVREEVESLRESSTDELEIEVCNDHPAPDGSGETDGLVRGAASLRLGPDDLAALERRVDEAVAMAALVHNPPYRLAEAAEYPEVPLVDPAAEASGNGLAAVRRSGDEILAAAAAERARGVRLSAAELFLTVTELELWTSRGIRASSSETGALAEIVVCAGDGQEEAEHFRMLQARRLVDLDLAGNIAEAARFAQDSLHAEMPVTRTGPVVLSGQALLPLVASPQMFGPGPVLAFQASAEAAHAQLSRLAVGAPITGDRELRGEPFRLRLNALSPYGLRSYRFDPDGLPGQDLAVVEDGVLVARPATLRYAQYLGLPATGRAGNLEVPAGATPLGELLADGPLCHVVAFSAPNVDPVTGDMGMEIRLGYEVGPRGVRPVKGGSVTGNLFAAFADARFSRETMSAHDYHGPLGVRFGELTVGGASG